jgi:proteasome maturation protein
MEGLRRNFGIAEPIRRGMELKIAREGEWRPAVLGGSQRGGVHEEILSGRDCEIAWEDVFVGDEMRGVPGFHEELERKVRMQ